MPGLQTHSAKEYVKGVKSLIGFECRICDDSLVEILLWGYGMQMAGLLALLSTFTFGWSQISIALLVPATAMIGFGQSFIVNCFYRIGLSDVPRHHAGAGSAMLSIVQQTAFGLGPMVPGTVYSQVLQQHGSYKEAVGAALIGELLLMLILVILTVTSGRRLQTQAG